MRLLATAFFLINSAAALAAIPVGTYVVFDINIDGVSAGSNKTIVTAATETEYTLNMTATVNEEKHEQNINVPVTNFYADEDIAFILENCENLEDQEGNAIAAKKETIKVPAGSFDVCTMEEGEGITASYGNVPLNLVRVTRTFEGKSIVNELSSYKLGE